MIPTPTPIARVVDAALEGTVVLSFSRVGSEVRSRLEGWPSTASLPGDGRRMLVTGGNSGLGYAAAGALAAAGAEVLVSVRDHDKGERTLTRLREDLGDDVAERVRYDVLDLGDLASVRTFAAARRAEAAPLHGIIHNAGAMFPDRAETVDGFERTYQVHVLAPFALTSDLLPLLAASAPSRVITVTSGGMYAQKLEVDQLESPDDYRPSLAYARAKRAQVVATRAWARRFGRSGIDFHVMHPGWALTPGVESSLPGFRRVMGPILRDPTEGADTAVYLALADDLGAGPGRLWHDRRPRNRHKVPWTRSPTGEEDALWDRLCRDAAREPSVTTTTADGS